MTLPIKKIRAFTLIELLIVMVLLAILASVSYTGIINARNHARLKSATDTVIGMIQTTRSYALSNMELDVGGVDCEAISYYVKFVGSTGVVNVYAVLDSDCGGEELLDTETIPEDIEMTLHGATTIYYYPPLAEVEFTGTITIELETIDEAFTKNIEVYPISGFPELID